MTTPSVTEEEEAIERCRRGDREAYGPLVERYQRMVFTLAYRMLGDENAAKDAVQESFIAAYLSLGSFRKNSKFSSWLCGITLHKCRDVLRDRHDTVPLGDVEAVLFDHRADPATHAQRRQEEDILQAALDQLPAEYREVIVLKHIRGLDYGEIQELTGASISALKVRTYRAREMLKTLLKEGRPIHG